MKIYKVVHYVNFAHHDYQRINTLSNNKVL